MIHFALLQTDIKFCDFDYNAAHVRELIETAVKKMPRPDVIVLPEDWSSGFSDEMFHHMEDHIEPENGPSVSFLRECARRHQVWIVAGSVGTRFEDGMRNTTFLINRQGEIVGDYSKMHLYSDMDEDVPYLHGTKKEVYDTELGRLGFLICYDIRFCELSRLYALKGAQALIVTSNFPNPRVSHWRTLLMARAIENQMFVVACNRVGESPMGTYCGHSIILDPWGNVIAEGGEGEEIVTGSLDYSVTDEIRSTIHMFRDRRPESYKELTSPGNFDRLRQEVLALCAGLPGKPAVLIEDLHTGETIRVNENERFPSASLIKLPILLRLFQMADEKKVDLTQRVTITEECRAEGFGILKELGDGLSPTWRDLAVLMIVLSDNIATNLLIDFLGMDGIGQEIAKLGLTGTVLQRRMMDAEAKKRGLDNYTTAADIGVILKKIERGGNQEPLSILLRQQCNQKLPALMTEDVKIAHKTGDLPGTEHDAGIIYIGPHKILAVVLTKELSDNLKGIQLNQEIGRLIEQYCRETD